MSALYWPYLRIHWDGEGPSGPSPNRVKAVGVGFEPTGSCGSTGTTSQPVRPLRQPTAKNIIRTGYDRSTTCPCPCHRVIQPGLIPCPSCDPEPEQSSRYVRGWGQPVGSIAPAGTTPSKIRHEAQ